MRLVSGAEVMTLQARVLCVRIAAATCSAGLGIVCLGALSGCSSAFAGDRASAEVARPVAAALSDTVPGMVSAPSSSADSDGLAGTAKGDGAGSSAEADQTGPKSGSDVWRDGTYYATGQGGRFGGVPVTVVIKAGRISSVTLRANSETDAMAEKARSVVVPQILKEQGVDDIDVASGATMTSDAIIDGVAQALERASE